MRIRRQLYYILRLAGWLEAVATIGRVLARFKNEVAVWADIRAFPALAVIAGLDCLAGLVVGRKFNGGPPLHLTNVRLSVGAFAVAVLVVAGRWWLSRIEREPPAHRLRVLLTAFCVLPMLALLSLANSQHSPWVVSFASALAVGSGGAVYLWNRISPVSPATVSAAVPSIAGQSIAVVLPFSTAMAPAGSKMKIPVEAGPTRTTRQFHGSDSDEWMRRTIDESGQVTLEGRALAEFAAGQSFVTVHIPFCPAFGRIPEFSSEVVNEPSVRARQPAVYRYGARLELKRTGDTVSPARVDIRFRATDLAEKSSRAA